MIPITESLKIIIAKISEQANLKPNFETDQNVDQNDNADPDLDTTTREAEESAEISLADSIAEIDKTIPIYIPLNPIHRKEKNTFRYFLNSSFQYYLLSLQTGNLRNKNIILSQAAISLLSRNDNGNLFPVKDYKFYFWLLFLDTTLITGELLDHIAINSKIPVHIKDINQPEFDENQGTFVLTEQCRGRIRHEVNEFENTLIEKFLKNNADGWLLKEGMISFGKFGTALQHPRVLGYAKNFTRLQKMYSSKGETLVQYDITDLLEELPVGYRTPAFFGYKGHTAFWYLRLHETKDNQNSLFGTVKLEIPVIDEQAVTTDLLNELSGALLADRSVSTFGMVGDWHKQLYPLYLAKQTTRNMLITEEIMRSNLSNLLKRNPI